MSFIKVISLCIVTALVGACSLNPYFADKPEITSVYVKKQDRKLYLMNGNEIIRSYNMGLGFAPTGHKQFENDGKTPEGTYFIDRKNPNSKFHLSLGISYPNAQDIARARAAGKAPGGDIFIHGQENKKRPKSQDWTAGCIAVTDREIEEIYDLVPVGTPIFIKP